MAESLIFNLDVDSSQAVQDINKFFDTFYQGTSHSKNMLNKAFNQKYETTVEIQFKNGQVVAKEIQNIKQESKRLEDTFNAVNGKLGRTPAQLKKQLSILKQLRDNTEKYSKSTGKVSQDWKTLSTRIDSASKALGRMGQGGSVMGRLKQGLTGFAPVFTLIQTAANLATAAIMGGIRAIMELGPAMTARAKDVENLRLTLSGFLESEKEVEAVMSSSKAIALTYGASLDEIEKGYKRLAPTILAAGGSLKDTEKVIVAMTARTTQLGLSGEQTSRYMEAIAQVFGKGKLQAEELTKQLSQMDGALRSQLDNYVRNETGFKSLTEAMDAGALTAEIFKDAFISVSEDAVKRLANEMHSLQDSVDSLTIQQVQNKIETLNAISLDSLNDTFKGFGTTMLRLQAGFAQFGASITNDLPAMTATSKFLMDALGLAFEMVVNGFLVGIKLILKAVDLVMIVIGKIVQAIGNFPGVSHLVSGVKALGNAWMESFRQGVDMLLATGDGVTKNITLMDKLENGVELTARQYDELEEKAKEAYSAQVKGLDEYLAGLKRLGGEEKEKIKESMEAIKEKIAVEKNGTKDLRKELKAKYDEEARSIDDKLSKLRQAYDLEKGEISAMSDAEKELEEIRRKELEAKAKNSDLTRKERLEAQASLDAMDRRLKLAEAEVIFKEKKEQLDLQAKENDKTREKHLDDVNKKSDERLKKLDALLSTEKEGIKAIDDEYSRYAKRVQEAKDAEAGMIIQNRNQALSAIDSQISRADDLRKMWNRVSTARSNAGSSGPDTDGVRFAGGPVSGGSAYTVNELGKEAFLSASGKLSMINAPSFGTWKAPSSGTVIPAHLTKQLEIPSKGVNINSAAKINASNAGSSPGAQLSKLAGAIVGMTRDNVTNNVTIQSANTTQTASDVMVQLAKLKRLRYN